MTQVSAVKRRFFWMQWRLCHESQNPAARRPWQKITLMRGL
jgi:hypothetical protein